MLGRDTGYRGGADTPASPDIQFYDLMTALRVYWFLTTVRITKPPQVDTLREDSEHFIMSSDSPHRNSQSIFYRFSNVPLFKSNITNCPNRLS